MEEIDLSEELQEFYEKHKHEKYIRNWEETLKKSKGFFMSNFLKDLVGGDGIDLLGGKGKVFNTLGFKDEDFIFSIWGIQSCNFLVYKKFILIERNFIKLSTYTYLKVNYSNFGNIRTYYTSNHLYFGLENLDGSFKTSLFNYPEVFEELDSILSKFSLEEERLKRLKELKELLPKIKILKLELTKKYDDCKTLINDIKNTQGKKLDLNKIEIKLNEQKRMIEVNSRFLNNESVISDLDLLKDLNTKFQKHQKIITNLLIELTTLNNLKQSQTNVLSELDKDGNGEVDVIEGNDFNLLLKKHQKSIVEIDRTYVQQFVKISGYLKTKEKNIQSIFNLIKDTPNQEVLNEYVEVLKDDIHSYNLILFNSLNMIVSLVEDDMITFYEIHEMFDTLNMFDSKHEKDVSQKLTNIGDGLESLMYEIRDMGNKISNSIDELSYVTEQSNEQLSNQLSEIDSTMKVGNLINTINTYQNYKNNRRLNS